MNYIIPYSPIKNNYKQRINIKEKNNKITGIRKIKKDTKINKKINIKRNINKKLRHHSL